MTSRKPEEIEAEILPLKWKLEELEKELKISKAINNYTNYNQYKGKWVFHNAYESGCDYIYVLGVTDDVDDVYFYGYGVHYDYQLKKLEIISSEYPSDFYIYYPDNVTIIDKKDVKKEVLKLLAEELDELLDSDNG